MAIKAKTIEFEMVQSRGRQDEYRVEGIDYDGDGQVYVAIFSGPNARERAEEYARFKNSNAPGLISPFRLRKKKGDTAAAQRLRQLLRGLYDYTSELERRYATWVVTRPSMAQHPPGGYELGKYVRAALGIEELPTVHRGFLLEAPKEE